MKHAFKMLCLMVIAATLSLVSCSKDEPSTTEDQADFTLKAETDVKELTVEFFAGLTDTEKSEVRKEYINSGLLKSWSVCPIKPDKEVWVIFCRVCSEHEADVPIRTDPCEEEEEEEEEKSGTTDETEPCQVKRVTWGNNCRF